MSEATKDPKLFRIEAIFAQILREKSGFELEELDRSATFLELGFDSLFLIQFSHELRNRFAATVTFRELIEDVSTIDALLEHLARTAKGADTAPETDSPPDTPAVIPTPTDLPFFNKY